jgi:poly(A) polymerase
VKHRLPLNQEWIDSQALKIVKKLQEHNHTTYLVGGCVRDLLIGLPPKDFDIATSAYPEQVNKIIRPSHIIGRRFQLVLVKRFGEQYEISTFRANTSNQEEGLDGPIMDDNTFGSAEEDARRRDFTINSFFYDPVEAELIDYCDGLKDIEQRTVRMIGDPSLRIQEDPLRMLRALRFAYKANFSIEPSLRDSIQKLAEQLTLAVLPRRREELLKFLRLTSARQLLWECFDLNLLKYLSPTLNQIYETEAVELFHLYLGQGLEYVSDSDNPNELFSVLLFSMIAAKSPKFIDELSLKNKEEESLMITMKDELGMYRVEQDLFLQTLTLIRQLKEIKNVHKIRDRYRNHLAKSNSLSSAITLAHGYKLLPEPDIHYWTEQFWLAQSKGKSTQQH